MHPLLGGVFITGWILLVVFWLRVGGFLNMAVVALLTIAPVSFRGYPSQEDTGEDLVCAFACI